MFLKSGKVNFYQESVDEITNIEDYVKDDFLCIVLWWVLVVAGVLRTTKKYENKNFS